MQNRYWLVMKTADGGERPFPIRSRRTVIGREPQSDVRIPLINIGSKHCEIILSGNELRLADLGTEIGTLHNGARVQEARLEHADELQVGPVTFEVRMQDQHDLASPGVDAGV